MSIVNLSRPDVDMRISRLTQTGSSDIAVNYERQVLRNDKEYV